MVPSSGLRVTVLPQDSGVMDAPLWSWAPHGDDKVGLKARRSPVPLITGGDVVGAPIFWKLKPGEGKEQLPSQLSRDPIPSFIPQWRS